MYKRVRDNEHLVKDLSSGAILSTNRDALAARRAERERVRQSANDHQRIETIEARLNELEDLVKRMVSEYGKT